METYIKFLTWFVTQFQPENLAHTTFVIHCVESVLIYVLWLKFMHNQLRRRGLFGKRVNNSFYFWSAFWAISLFDSLNLLPGLLVMTIAMPVFYHVMRLVTNHAGFFLQETVAQLETTDRSLIAQSNYF